MALSLLWKGFADERLCVDFFRKNLRIRLLQGKQHLQYMHDIRIVAQIRKIEIGGVAHSINVTACLSDQALRAILAVSRSSLYDDLLFCRVCKGE
jgi:hypothetical protein